MFLKAVFLRTLLGVFCWWLISEGQADAWLLGGPAVGVAVAFSFYLQPPSRYRLSLFGLLAFWWFFSWRSLLAGLQVARLILSPRLVFQPGQTQMQLRLPEGAPRWLLAMTLSLLPGSISLQLDGRQLKLHWLDKRAAATPAELRDVEDRVARVFGLAASLPLQESQDRRQAND